MKLSRILPITVFALMLSPLADADNQRRIDVDSKVVTQHKAKPFSAALSFKPHPGWASASESWAPRCAHSIAGVQSLILSL